MKKDERLFFIAVSFGKYLEYYGSKNNYMLNIEQIERDVMPAIDDELTEWFKQPPLTDKEINHCIRYLHIVHDRILTVDKKEREKIK